MRTVAFYLPQFHAIPENDEWWGEGFTEWTNVRRAKPQFEGHAHPRVPALGEYSLTDPAVYRQQSDLALQYGVEAFCMYYYWFDGQRLLERPVEAWRTDGTLLPYCLSWANESWTRRWDGKTRDVLMPQGYAPGYADDLFDDLLPHFQAPHYLRQGGEPILVVHRADIIPDPRAFAETFRRRAKQAGLPGVHLVAAETTHGVDPLALGFDAAVEFPPVGANTLRTSALTPIRGVARDFSGRLMSYERLAQYFAARAEPDFVRYRSVVPGWDNTARRQSKATVYVGATPEKFSCWVDQARAKESTARGDHGLMFVNAWNEWAEGAYLEPDVEHGYGYLEALRGAPTTRHADSHRRARVWSLPHLRSLALAFAGSVLNVARRVRARLR